MVLFQSLHSKMLGTSLLVVSLVALSSFVVTNGQQRQGLVAQCKKNEYVPNCVPCIQTCHDRGKRSCDSTFHCIPTSFCYCIPGFARIRPNGPCIPEVRCEHPFHFLFVNPPEVDMGDPGHHIAHHDIDRGQKQRQHFIPFQLF